MTILYDCWRCGKATEATAADIAAARAAERAVIAAHGRTVPPLDTSDAIAFRDYGRDYCRTCSGEAR